MWDDYLLWPGVFGALWIATFLIMNWRFIRSRMLRTKGRMLRPYGEAGGDKTCLARNRSWRVAGPFVELNLNSDCICGHCIDACKTVLSEELLRKGQLRPVGDRDPELEKFFDQAMAAYAAAKKIRETNPPPESWEWEEYFTWSKAADATALASVARSRQLLDTPLEQPLGGEVT
jgi:hypothetical protein